MQNQIRSRHVRAMVTSASVIISLCLGVLATAQPPQPRSELLVDPVTPESRDQESRDQDHFESDPSRAMEYLTRAPLHEAFASPYEADPTPNPVVQKEPPEPIDELPPEYRPSGVDVIWIPGYWSWDDERADFIWISGVWRDIPPQQRWVPGYWADVAEGYQYVSGFWAGDQVADVEYLPLPPQSLEQGPASPSPGENYFYVPGNWVYQSSDYHWQPGFWSQAHQNWVWVPPQYVWTPTGCIHQNGYWDYDIARRGVVFTPVYFEQPIYRQAHYSYRPQYTVDTGLSLFVHLFVRSNQRQYYYGDYYGSSYSNTYYPWSTRYQRNRYYDPFFASYRHRSHGGGKNNYISWINKQHQVFVNNQQYRPARTISAQRDFLRTHQGADIDPSVLRLTSMGESLENLARSNDNKQKFQHLSREQIEHVRNETAPQRQLRRDRFKTETPTRGEQTKRNTKEETAKSPRPDGNSAADVTVNANADGSSKADVKLNPKANGRGRLHLPERSRPANDAERNPGRNKRASGNAATNPTRQGGTGEINARAEKALDSVSGAARNDSQRGTDMRKDMRKRLEQATGDVDGSRRPATQRLRPATPRNWPTASPGQAARPILGQPEARSNAQRNRGGQAATGNTQDARGRTGPRGNAGERPAVDRSPDRGSRAPNTRPSNTRASNTRASNTRAPNTRPSNAQGGNTAKPATRDVQRGSRASKGGGASPGQPAGKQQKPSGKPDKKPKDK